MRGKDIQMIYIGLNNNYNINILQAYPIKCLHSSFPKVSTFLKIFFISLYHIIAKKKLNN